MRFERKKNQVTDSVFVAAILGDGYRPVEAICPSPLNFSKTILFFNYPIFKTLFQLLFVLSISSLGLFAYSFCR